MFSFKAYCSVVVLFLLHLTTWGVTAQEDLLDLIGEEATTEYTTASFKTNRVINLHSLENTAAGVMDFKISHRFGQLNGGFYDLFGLDNATLRLGFDFGLTDNIVVGVGRSSLEKTYDMFSKIKILRQSTGKKNMPITLAIFNSVAVQTLRDSDPDRKTPFTGRLFYTHQLILGRKFSESFTLQLSPTLVHRNLTQTAAEKNTVWALGVGTRYKLSKRVAINGEYIYVGPDQLRPGFKNSLSIGFDIETGGHVFQLHFTNSNSMIEKGFITETNGNWLDGDIHFGFNISRVFTL